MSVNGRLREDILANCLQLFEYLRDILGPPEPSPAAMAAMAANPAPAPCGWSASRPCLHHTGTTTRLPSQMRLLEGLSQPPVANAFASNRSNWRNSKPDNACVTSQDNSFGP